jgi:hypothetical protein
VVYQSGRGTEPPQVSRRQFYGSPATSNSTGGTSPIGSSGLRLLNRSGLQQAGNARRSGGAPGRQLA